MKTGSRKTAELVKGTAAAGCLHSRVTNPSTYFIFSECIDIV